MLVNGNSFILEKNCTVAEFLADGEYNCGRVVVEKNGVIIPRKNYHGEILDDNDKLEIISFVGGG